MELLNLVVYTPSESLEGYELYEEIR